ncbi:MAG: hypothetical protein JNK50_00520 [Bacteroidia bacterium]|nr:hypothetical protein [Bacteroidia bacterium]
MTEEVLHNKMRQMCLDEVRDSGWWIFNKKTISFKKTEFIDECNIQIIQQLPDNISFPKKSDKVIIDDKGIKNEGVMYSWGDIIATGVKNEKIPMEYMDDDKISVLIGLTNGQIKEIPIRDNIDYRNQVGHLIELYKLKFKKHADT